MRSSIFIKIFFGFWLVSIAVLGSWMFASHYFDSIRFSEREHRHDDVPPQRLVLRLIWGLENAPAERLAVIMEQTRRKHDVQAWLLDEAGADISRQAVPEEIQAIAERLQRGRRRAFDPGKERHLIAHNILRRGEPRLRLVLSFPPPPHRLLGLLGTHLWLRLMLAVLVSGLACYGLSRLMTSRLRDLRQASRQLAEGDLSARISVRDSGGDETDELARDFNTMADQLENRMRAQKRLLSDVSHELRSPLARLRVALALATESSDKRTDYLQRMDKETDRLEELISQLLSTQEQDMQADRHVDMVALLSELCADASFEGKEQDKTVRLDTSLEDAVVASSGDLLLKSFDNMIRNALRHTAPGTEVRVCLALEGENFRIDIEDRGPGVEETDLARIFDEFYRVDTARSREDGGYGLGLAIARRAIAQHGGQLQASNTGTGLLLTATLPRHS